MSQEMKTAYITSLGTYLPGPPIDNEKMEFILGQVNDKPSRLRSRILKSNGIKTRHYALDSSQRTTHQNSELASAAARSCLDRAAVDPERIDMLAVATTQGDLPLPGMASMVQADLQLGPLEIITTHGVCSSGVMALKSAVSQIRLGDKNHALVCAAELASRLLKRSRYEAAHKQVVDFEAEFLRWMLSDGAGAALIESAPRARGISLRIDWIEIVSYASDFDLCMSCGTADQSVWTADGMSSSSKEGPPMNSSWQDYPTYAEAEQAGALLIRQNLRLLDNIVKVGVDGFLKLINAGRIDPAEIDYFLCHYSSDHFRGRILELFKLAGCMVPEERWFTNLYSKGNTGCASIFIMLEELFQSDKLKPGQVLFCVVPESGRFTTAYIKLTVVEGRK